MYVIYFVYFGYYKLDGHDQFDKVWTEDENQLNIVARLIAS